MRVRLGLLFVAALVPAASAQIQNPDGSTPTTLYFHIFDTYNIFAVNTQPMDVAFFNVSGTNVPTIAPYGYDFNTIYGFSTSGPVEYGVSENGRPRFHPERGIAADVLIDAAVQPVVYLYVDVRDVFSLDHDGAGTPQFLPSFTFRVTMRQGNEIGPDANLDAGQLIMAGSTTAHLADTHELGANDALEGLSTPDGTPVLVADEAGFVEVMVPMTIDTPLIPKSDSFNIRIDWYQNPTGDAAQDDQFAEGWLRLGLDAQHLPRLEMAVRNPVYIDFIHPQVAAGTLLIHAGLNSPWGTYDVDVANLTLTVTGPTAPKDLPLVVSQNARVHGRHDNSAEVTWLWRFRNEDAKSGEYGIELRASNMANTATAVGKASFTIEGKRAFGVNDEGDIVAPAAGADEKSSPAPVALAPLLLALAAVAARRGKLQWHIVQRFPPPTPADRTGISRISGMTR